MKNNVFENDVVIPKSVLEKLDIALEQTRTDSERDTRVQRIKAKKRKQRLHKQIIAISTVAAVACMAIVVTPIIDKALIKYNGGENVVLDKLENDNKVAKAGFFTITASAAELIPGEPATFFSNENNIYMAFNGSKNEGIKDDCEVKYTIPVPLLVDGDNIKSVTYSINKGAFQLLSKDEVYAKDAKIWENNDDNFSVINMYEEYYYEDNSGDFPEYAIDYYTEFTIDYENQKAQQNGFNIVGIANVTDEVYDMLFPDADNYQGNDYNAQTAEGMSQLYKDVFITVTAHYNDGTEDTQYLGLGGMLIKDPYSEDEDAKVSVVSCTLYTDIPTVVCTESNEYKACMEYNAFLDGYDQDGAILNEIGNSPTEFDEKYFAYMVYTQEMADKVDEICAKYGLQLIDGSSFEDMYSEEEFKDKLGVMPFKEGYRGNISGYKYSDGSFHLDGDTDINGQTIDYQVERHMKGYFSTVMLRVTDFESFKKWDYTTSDGTKVTLSLGPDKALIQVSLDNSFVFVNVLDGTDMGWLDNGVRIDEADLEALAEAFNFGQY